MRYIISSAFASLVVTAAAAEVPKVVTDIPPVHALVAQVMGEIGQPVLLLDRGANAHSFQLRPSQAGEVEGADLVVWIGPEMTPWLDRAVGSLASDVAQLRLLAADGTHVRAYGEATGDGHDHGAEDHAGADHADEGHDHAGTDPHAWLDPANAAAWLGLIADELSRLDPGNAAAYAANAEAGRAAVAAADAAAAAALAPVRERPFVVFHDAYGYFADHYGLTVAGEISAGDATDPGAARVADLRAVVAEGKAVCVFPEANHDPKLVAQIAEGTGARVGGALDPSGSTLEPGPGLYATLIAGTAETIAACLGAAP